MEESLRVRDFIYMDVERLKSILAQVDRGVTEKLQEAFTETENDVDRKEGGAFNLFKAISENQYLFQTQKSESRVLHDYLYHHVLKKLNNENLITNIPGVTAEATALDYIGQLNHTSFVLIKGNSIINDFGYLKNLLDNFNEIMRFVEFGQIEVEAVALNLNESQKQQRLSKLTKKEYVDKRTKEGIKTLLDTFFKDRVVYKAIPFSDNPDFRFVGTLRSESLRESIHDIIYKYGTEPTSPWYMFAQIASIPKENEESIFKLSEHGNPLEAALQAMFSSIRDIEKTGLTASFPEIAVTPIAIYRE